MINRLLHAWYCVRQGAEFFQSANKNLYFCLFVFFPRSDLNIQPIAAYHVSNEKHTQMFDHICKLLFLSRGYNLRVMIELIY